MGLEEQPPKFSRKRTFWSCTKSISRKYFQCNIIRLSRLKCTTLCIYVAYLLIMPLGSRKSPSPWSAPSFLARFWKATHELSPELQRVYGETTKEIYLSCKSLAKGGGITKRARTKRQKIRREFWKGVLQNVEAKKLLELLEPALMSMCEGRMTFKWVHVKRQDSSPWQTSAACTNWVTALNWLVRTCVSRFRWARMQDLRGWQWFVATFEHT